MTNLLCRVICGCMITLEAKNHESLNMLSLFPATLFERVNFSLLSAINVTLLNCTLLNHFVPLCVKGEWDRGLDPCLALAKVGLRHDTLSTTLWLMLDSLLSKMEQMMLGIYGWGKMAGII